MIHTFEGLSEAQREAVQLSNRTPHKVVSVTKTLSHGGVRYGVYLEGTEIPKADKVLDTYKNGLVGWETIAQQNVRVTEPKQASATIQEPAATPAKQAVNKDVGKTQPAKTEEAQKASAERVEVKKEEPKKD